MSSRSLLVSSLLLFAATSVAAQSATWRAQTSGTTDALTGISFGSATTGVAVGDNGTILRTTDGGIRWEKVSVSGLDSTRCCTQVRFFDASVAWLVGAGVVIRSQSTGSSWFGANYSGYIRKAIVPVASDTAWYVANSSGGPRAFFRHVIQGNNSTFKLWQHSDLDTMYDIDFTDPQNGWAVGSPGRIVRITSATSDDPVFANQTSGTNLALHGIDMIDGSNGWVVGDGGTILHTTNGGATWTKQPSGVTNGLRSVSFKSALEGYAVGTAGIILATNDGGSSWHVETSGVSNELDGVFAGGQVVAVGSAGTIVRRTTTPGGCDYSLNPTSSLLVQTGGTATLSVTTQAGCQWTAASDSSWLTVTSGASGTGNGSVSAAVASNPNAAAREGHINVGTASFAVTQYGTSGTCSFAVSPTSATVGAAAGTGTVNVTTLAGCNWVFTSSVPWITMDTPFFRMGNGTAVYSVAANPTNASRSGTISINATTRVTITQTAPPARRRSVRH